VLIAENSRQKNLRMPFRKASGDFCLLGFSLIRQRSAP
jgi:hypothetical protein